MEIQFEVPSEMYGTTTACISDLERTLRIGYCDCSSGEGYTLTRDEVKRLKIMMEDDTADWYGFIPSNKLPHPFNKIALLQCDGMRMELPKHFRFSKQDYDNVKRAILQAGGKYRNNGFDFKEEAAIVYDRILSGDEFNMKKKHQFFATPEALAEKLVRLAEIKKGDAILEPSAGQGAIIDAIMKVNNESNTLFYCENMHTNRLILHEKYGHFTEVYPLQPFNDDFLELIPAENFEKIIANPPFSKNQDIDHVLKMFDVLKEGGRLVSVTSKHWQSSNNKKEVNFQNWVNENNAKVYEIDEGSFKESGTSVGGLIIVVDKLKVA